MSSSPEQIDRELNRSHECAVALYAGIVDFHPKLVPEADAIISDDDTPLVTLVRLGGLLPYTPREANIHVQRNSTEVAQQIKAEASRRSEVSRRVGIATVNALFRATDRLDDFKDYMGEQSKAYRACTWLGAGLMTAASVRIMQYMGAGYEPDSVGLGLLGAGLGTLYVANQHMATTQ